MESKLESGREWTIISYNTAQGCGPTVLRAMVVNAAQLGTYSQAKQFLLATGMVMFTLRFVMVIVIVCRVFQ